MKVTIVGGSGKMGRWFANLLKEDGKEVTLVGRNEERLAMAGEQLGVGITVDLPSAVKEADVIIISVPINSFEDVARELGSHLNSAQVVLDITSVKTMPVETMHKYLGEASVLGTHPVFGPGAKGLHRQNFVLTPTNDKETTLAEKVSRYLEERGANVTLMSPQEHDKMVAIILGLAHFIAIVSADSLLSFQNLRQMAEISGPTYKTLLTLSESVLTEDPELYASIQMNLPGITEVEELFLENVEKWADLVKNRDTNGFIRRMGDLKEKLTREEPDFGKSYEDMYKLLEGL